MTRARSASLWGGATALAAWHAAPALSCHVAALSDALGVRRRVASGVALTFDDGPDRRATPLVLSALARAGARATFFLVGEQVRREPGLAREIAAAGHTIGLHGGSHRCELRLSPRALAADRAAGLDAITTATGVTPTLHRPPYGAASGAGLTLARRAGLETVLWSRWGRDWTRRATPESVVGRVLAAGPPAGDIILLHDSDRYGAEGCWRATVAGLPELLARLADAGLEPVTL